jgi:vitamin B12 transporter
MSRFRPLACRAVSLVVLAAALPAAAAPDEIIVTAARLPVAIDAVGSSVSVIDTAAIERRQVRGVVDALKLVPGADLVQLGAEGHQTSIFVRGGNANQLLVLRDGQPIADPSTPAGALDLAPFGLADIERIELVRGPLAAVYGSQAMAGVLNLVTRAPTSSGADARLEGGTRDSYRAQGRVRLVTGGLRLEAGAERLYSGGEDVTPRNARGNRPAENDPVRRDAAHALAEADLGERVTARAAARWSRARVALDTSPEDPNAVETTRNLDLSASVTARFGGWTPTVTATRTDYLRRDLDQADQYSATIVDTRNEGRRERAQWNNKLALFDGHVLDLGAEFEREQFTADGFSDFGGFRIAERSHRAQRRTGAWITDFVTWGALSGAASLRVDDPSDYAKRVSWTVAPSWRIDEATRLKAAVGTGFKVPALYERFGFQPTNFGSAFRGNPDLRLERSRSWEVGLERSFLAQRVHVGATWFDAQYRDSIQTVFLPSFSSTTVNNVDAHAKGLESFVAVALAPGWNVRLDHGFTVAQDTRGRELLRRPKHRASGELAYESDELAGSLTGRFVGGRNDVAADGATVRAGGYITFDAAGWWRLSEQVRITARLVNLLDRQTEPAIGFAGPRRQFYAGAEVRF